MEETDLQRRRLTGTAENKGRRCARISSIYAIDTKTLCVDINLMKVKEFLVL